MTLIVNGDALRLLEHFLHYSQTNTYEMADAMHYDYDGFENRMYALLKAFNEAVDRRDAR